MARDRKRAKQRRDRTRRAPGATAESRPRRRDEDDPAALTGAEAQPTTEAPEPLDHASAEADIANAQIALGRAESDAADEGRDALGDPGDPEARGGAFADAEGLDAGPGTAYDDELEEAADARVAGNAGGGGRRGARTARDAGDEGEGLPEHGPGSTREALEGMAPRSPAPQGNRAIAFLRASWRELQRVQWPDRRQVAQATAVVLVFVVIAGFYLGLADFVFSELVEVII